MRCGRAALCWALVTSCGRADFELARLTLGDPEGGASSVDEHDAAGDVDTGVSDSPVSSIVEAGSPVNSLPVLDAGPDGLPTASEPPVNSPPDAGPSSGGSDLDGATDIVTSISEGGTTDDDTGSGSSEAGTEPTSVEPSDAGGNATDPVGDGGGSDPDAALRQDGGTDGLGEDAGSDDAGQVLQPACTAGTARYPTVQSVIDDAACPTVYVPAQTFVEDLNVERDVQIEGVAAASSVIEGTGTTSVIQIVSGVAVGISAITVRGGGGAQGGGIHSAAELSLSDVRVTDNVVSAVEAAGGGIYQAGATLNLTNTQIENNRAVASGAVSSARGGGIAALLGAQVTADGVHFEANQVQAGGEGEDSTVLGAGLHIEGSSSFSSTGAGVEFIANVAALIEPGPFVILEANGAGVSCAASEIELASGVDRIASNLLTLEADSTVGTAAGAGLFATGCSLQLAAVEVTGNTLSVTAGQASTGYGAGAAIVGSVLAWTDVPCSGNRLQAQVVAGSNWSAVGHGGCLSVEDSSAVVTHSTFWNNGIDATGGSGVVFADGGALFVQATSAEAVMSVQNSSFGPNNEVLVSGTQPGTSQRASGGAITVSGVNSGTQRLVIASSTLSGNLAEAQGTDATAEGGAMVLRSDLGGGAELDVSSSTFAANTVSGAHGGGGLYLREDSTGPTFPTIRNTILAGNIGLGTDCESNGPELLMLGENLLQSVECTTVGAGSTLTGSDPELGVLADNGGGVLTCALSSTSIARDRGPMAGCEDEGGNLLTVDSRGLPRMGTCDLGAFEAQADE